MLLTEQRDAISPGIFADAVTNTANQRSMSRLLPQAGHILDTVEGSSATAELWRRYQTAYKYAAGVEFADVISSLRLLTEWYNDNK